jgi:hypothetical protein
MCPYKMTPKKPRRSTGTTFLSANRRLMNSPAPTTAESAASPLRSIKILTTALSLESAADDLRVDTVHRSTEGLRQHIRALGLVRIATDASPALARATIESVSVLGAFQCSESVRNALAGRIL